MPDCPFCTISIDKSSDRKQIANALGFVIRDAFPVSQGHTLIIPHRHVQSFFELTDEEKITLLSLLEQAKAELDTEYCPASYNIGINDGPAAGQTVPHVHIHLIPRYEQVGQDPRGGVRWVIPDKAKYWSDS